MPFLVPWRCLVPLDALSHVFGGAGGGDGGVGEATGAEVKVSTEDEAPTTLSDKIVTVSGLASQKEEACRLILERLWKCQGIAPTEEGIFVLVAPTCAVGAVIGTKGAKIKEIMEASGADINVGREAIIGMPDNPMVITGTEAQVLSATVNINMVLQELAERDRLKEDDFRYIPGRQSAPRPAPRGGGASGLAARLIVSKGDAGFLIGKGGQKVRDLKEESGAFLQFRSAEEEPALRLTDDERVLEIRGSAAEREQGVRVVLAAMEQTPDPPRHSKLLVSTTLDRASLEEAAASAGVVFALGADTRMGSPEPGEVVATVEGTMSSRSKAILGMLALLDNRSGVVPARTDLQPGRPSFEPQPPVQTTTPSRVDQRAEPAAKVPESPSTPAFGAQLGTIEEEEEERIEPETKKAFTWTAFQIEFSKVYSEKDTRDYWRDACKPVPRKARSVAPDVKVDHGGNDHTRTQDTSETSRPSMPAVAATSHEASQPQRTPDRLSDSADMHAQTRPDVTPAAKPEVAQQERPANRGADVADLPVQPEPQPVVQAPQPPRETQAPQEAWQERQPQQQQESARQNHEAFQHQPVHDAAKAADPISFTPLPPGLPSGTAAQQQSPFASSGPMMGFSQQAAMTGCKVPGMLGGFHPHCGLPCGQLQLLLPRSTVQDKLAPGGQLAAIAQACSVQIDLANGAPVDQLHVIVSGTCVANSLAVLMLQWHILFAEAG